MAQRTVLRMSLAQMRATREDEQPPPLGTAASDDTIYFVTLDIVKSNDPKEPHVWGITFGPSRSREHAFQFVARSYPNTQAVMREIGNFNRMVWEENNHFRWEDQNGDKYTLRLEQVRSAAVRASSQEEVFMVIRTVEPFGEEPGAHHSNIEGVFLNDSDATTFAVRSMKRNRSTNSGGPF